jgi:hypothetical protein
MATKLHPAKWGPRDDTWDGFITDLIQVRGFGYERIYFGVTTQDRAEQIRRGLRNTRRHLHVAVKAFWEPCTGCEPGGADCRFHIRYTAYDLDDARAYKAAGTPRMNG